MVPHTLANELRIFNFSEKEKMKLKEKGKKWLAKYREYMNAVDKIDIYDGGDDTSHYCCVHNCMCIFFFHLLFHFILFYFTVLIVLNICMHIMQYKMK